MAIVYNKHVLFIPFRGGIIEESSADYPVFLPHLFESLTAICHYCDYELAVIGSDDVLFRAASEVLGRESIVLSDEVPVLASNDIAYVLYPDRTSFRIENAELLNCGSWRSIASYLADDSLLADRMAEIHRKTLETDIDVKVELDGCGNGTADTKLPFFDHMLAQLIKHSRFNLDIHADGDVEIDEHHTVEDIAIALGECILRALGDKRGIERYGFEVLMMDDVVITLAVDFSGRSEFFYDVDFRREYVGTFPTELFRHFFRSFTQSAKCNLYITATEGGDAHHTAEGMFKAFARALRKAVRRIPGAVELPSTKGIL